MMNVRDARFDPAEKLGAALIAAGLVDKAGLDRAKRLATSQGAGLSSMLAQLGLVSERDLAGALADASGCVHVGASDMPTQPIGGDAVSPKFLRERRILPIAADPGSAGDADCRLAMADPFDGYSVEAFRLASGMTPAICVAEPGLIERTIDRLYGAATTAPALELEDPAEEIEVARLKDLASEAPVIQLVNNLIAKAVEDRASDIHIEPYEARLDIRFRIDGALAPGPEAPDRLRAAIISRVKIMAGLDIAERRLPQDGRIKTVVRGRAVDLRISTLPVIHGESVVIRILDRDSVALDFDSLGVGGEARESLAGVLARPNGVFLVTGPTGSGKTTTLYAALTALKTPEKKMLTVEDPVEYQIEGVNQVQVRPGVGLDFARVLRSMLRQDPDVIMVGEIRDAETARIAAQSALTGHVVLSTLHTNDAAGAITRLLDMGLEAFLLTSTLGGVAAQRLVRRLCPDCKEAYTPSADLVRQIGAARMGGGATLWRPRGCEACGGRGYRGRTMIIEVLTVTERIRSLILAGAAVADLERAAIEEGMRPMFDDGVALACEGVTSIEEVFAVARAG